MLLSEQILWPSPDLALPPNGVFPDPGPTDPVTEAAITAAALVCHLDDARFASLRGLRQLHRALGAERVALGYLSEDGMRIQEELVWAGGFGRCGESERTIATDTLADEIETWLEMPRQMSLELDIDVLSPVWHELACDHLLLVRGDLVVPGRGRLVLVAQLRHPVGLAHGADQAITVLLHQYGRRQQSPVVV